ARIAPEHIGFKAHNLARMHALGLRVPPAFVLGTAWATSGKAIGPAAWQHALTRLEQACGLHFGDDRKPLLVSVRSGAPVSMPGMLDTLLNIGLTERTVAGLVRLTGNPRLAWDAYRRLVASFGETVLHVPAAAFAADLERVSPGSDARELDYAQLRELAHFHAETALRESGAAFPQDPQAQLTAAIGAVIASWGSDKARTWRASHAIAEGMGTAVTVQQMVFGNSGALSGAGVGFTRDPTTGEPAPWVDFLFGAQGEDVVSGRSSASGHEELAHVLPGVWEELSSGCRTLEQGLHDMQDFEFTVDNGCLYFLQCRGGKRTPRAAARIALDLFDEQVIDRQEALARTGGLDAASLSWLEVTAADGAPLQPIGAAASGCTGVASGPVAFDEQSARACASAGTPAILVRENAETADIAALELAAGLLTANGARTSHAAVVARQLGKVCLVGCDALRLSASEGIAYFGSQPVRSGQVVTLDGNRGLVFEGRVQTRRIEPKDLLDRLASLRAPLAQPA
ncbi:MAG TPA: PEP/pyruvate-binding domain-containing protein, partial [Ramlibacter sp.]